MTEPDAPIIDAHAHAWQVWPYLPVVPDPDTRGSADQLLWEMDQAGVGRAVLIAAEIDGNPSNNAHVAGLSRLHPSRFSHFSCVECWWEPTYRTPGSSDRLDRIIRRHAPAGLVIYFGQEPDDWPLSADGAAFWDRVAEARLPVSVATNPRWQPAIAAIAERWPDVVFLLNHLGSFRSGGADREEAVALILATLRRPNVMIKVSGTHYGSPTPWEFPNREALRLVRRICDTVGHRRLCWGSDFPVVKRDRSFTYRQTLEFVRTCCDFLSPEERQDVLGRNIARIIRPS